MFKFNKKNNNKNTQSPETQALENQDIKQKKTSSGRIISSMIIALALIFLGLFCTVGKDIFFASNVQDVVTIDDEEIAKNISDEVMTTIDEYLDTKLDENGNQIVLTSEELEKLQSMVSNEVLTTVDKTDLLALSDAELNDVILNMQNDILNNILKNSSLSSYFTEEDYKNIANHMASSITSNVEELQSQITTNKNASEQRDATQDESIVSLRNEIQANQDSAKKNSDDTTTLISSTKSSLETAVKTLEVELKNADAELKQEIMNNLEPRVKKLEDGNTAEDGSRFQYGYDEESGAYGYYVDEQFYPF